MQFFKWLPDKIYLKLLYRLKMGCRLNLKQPKTFSEKIQWLKLYDREPEYTQMVDKYEVKKLVSSLFGNELIIPTLGIWDNPDDIEWDNLPSQFVLKTTHGGGSVGVIICKDKSTFDKRLAVSRLKKSLKQDIYYYCREWPYKDVKKRIIAETYLSDLDKEDLTDYKFFCFNGEPVYCQVIQDRRSFETIDFFNMNWEHQEFIGLNVYAQSSIAPIACPVNWDRMKEIAKVLAKGHAFVRVDLYEVEKKVYFGEITFYPMSGLGQFSPDVWNLRLGELINIGSKGE